MVKTKRIIVDCSYCKKKMEVSLFRRKKHKHLFCSTQCYINWRKKKITVPCSYCGKKIEIFPLRKRSNNLYCSRNCYYKARMKKIPTTCEYCGKNIEITPSKKKRSNHYFCSVNCRGNWQRKRITVKCDFCGKEMTVKPSRIKEHKHLFCSVQCYDDWQRKNTPVGKDNKDWNRMETKCAFCGKKLQKIPSRLKKYANQFCNMDCMAKWKKQNVLGDKNPHWNSKLISCDFCGKDTFIKKSKLNKDKHHFCDEVCYLKWLRENPRIGEANSNWNRVEMNCDFCGEKIYVTSYRLDLSKNHFCNKSCFDKWSKINKPRGRNSPTWKGGSVPFYGTCWTTQKRKILERAKYASEISGNNGGLLDVHHIIPMRDFIQKYIDLCLEAIPSITLSSFKVLPYYLLIPDAIFEEANKESNLICVTRNEHPEIEGMPPAFFEAILRKLNNASCN